MNVTKRKCEGENGEKGRVNVENLRREELGMWRRDKWRMWRSGEFGEREGQRREGKAGRSKCRGVCTRRAEERKPE